MAQLRAFEAALEASPRTANALITPAVPGSRKKAVVGRVAEILELSPITRNFLFILMDHRRIAALRRDRPELRADRGRAPGFRARRSVFAPRELTEPQRAALNAELERLTGKRIRARFAVDEALIGGVVARIGSTVYDGSVRGQLKSLERRLGAEG